MRKPNMTEGSRVIVEKISNGYICRHCDPGTMKEHVVYHASYPVAADKLKPVKVTSRTTPKADTKKGKW